MLRVTFPKLRIGEFLASIPIIQGGMGIGISLSGLSSSVANQGGIGVIAVAGIGWASVVSLPFAIMSEKVDQTKMGLYMGIFNLSVVLPQLVASFKMGEVVNAAADKSVIFAICAVCLTISGLLWFSVKNDK